jgi:phosphatidate cytidylyltransferase
VRLGKIKLFERHSPKKTWEGLGGGLFTSLLVAFILSTYYTELAAVHWAIISVIIVMVGTCGDLTESMLKRSLHAKDSGSLLPGHGGLLDRFDGLLLAAPIVFTYLYFVLVL